MKCLIDSNDLRTTIADCLWVSDRGKEIAQIITEIWKVPLGHRSGFTPEKPRLRKTVDLSDLIVGGVLQPGMSLFPRRKKYSHRIATLLSDGRVDVDGVAFSSPSEAAVSIVGKRTNGWWFFVVDQTSKRSLRNVRHDYLDAMSVEDLDDDSDDDVEEDEA